MIHTAEGMGFLWLYIVKFLRCFRGNRCASVPEKLSLVVAGLKITTTNQYFILCRKLDDQGLFYQHGLGLILVWLSNQLPDKMQNEIIYPF